MPPISIESTIKIADSREKFKLSKAEQEEENRRKGREFEEFIVESFHRKFFKLLEWRSDKKTKSGIYPESNKYPDLEFAFGDSKKRFAVECKWKAKAQAGKIEWATLNQISNYQSFQKERKIDVFIAIGLGGTACSPEKLYVTPLKHFQNRTHVTEVELVKFSKNPRSRFYFNYEQGKLL